MWWPKINGTKTTTMISTRNNLKEMVKMIKSKNRRKESLKKILRISKITMKGIKKNIQQRLESLLISLLNKLKNYVALDPSQQD